MTETTVLITGGAGYIGSHTVLACREGGYRVVVLDNLVKGRRELLPDDVPFYLGDVGDPLMVGRIFDEHPIAAVLHFAGDIVVPESVAAPLTYYANNTCKTRQLLQLCVDRNIERFVFSSTAAVYGEPRSQPVTEQAPTQPVNPYGSSKLMVEWMLRDTALAHDFRNVILRYFNVAGADPSGRTGQATPGATHLIKVACEVATGKRSELRLFGDDYDTADGTCVRDYIHVTDLAEAHVRSLDHLMGGGQCLTLNCGYGRGYSVREVVEGINRIVDAPLNVRRAPRRPGDVASLVADPSGLLTAFDWKPRHDDLDTILRTALDWERRHGAG